MTRLFAVLNADSDAARTACKAAGATHAVINAYWDSMQPTGTGALNPAAAAKLVADYAHALSIGLKPILSINLHYTPAWVQSSVEPFRDQAGNNYTVTDNITGKAVRNWMWTATGRTYVSDLTTRVAAALGAANIAATDGCRLGGGWFGELHYPEPAAGAPSPAWQGFGPSMQTGTGLAAGMSVCPLPGYVPFTGTDAQDCTWLNWYLNGIVAWVLWQIDLHKSLGFTRNLWVLMPGYGARTDSLRSDTIYRSSASYGEDHVRLLGAIMHDPAVWPYSTWLDTVDGNPAGTTDSAKAQWKSIYEKALARGKHWNLVGENTSGETNANMDTIFADALGGSVYTGSPGAPSQGYYYRGIVWLDYASLISGGAVADMAHFASKIASAHS